MKRFLNLSVVLLVFLVFSCSSSKSQNDSDMFHDEDIDSQDSEIQDDDSDAQGSEIVDDYDELPDADADQDQDVFDEDWQRDIDIPEMSDDPYYEAYGDADFNVAYYYYGDDPSPAKDPENVKALWSKRCKNDSCTECTPKPYDLCAENYPFEPQIIGGGSGKKKSTAGKFQCDALLTPGNWYAHDLANSMEFNEFDGKILYYMTAPKTSWQGGSTFVYDLDTRKVERYGRGYMEGWQNKRYYFISTYDYRIDTDNEGSPYYGRNERHLLYYDKETNTYGLAFKMPENTTNIVDVRANENYIFMSAHFAEDASDMRILYTRIGEWDKWKELNYKKATLYGNSRRAGYPSMFENLVTYFDYDIQVQVCDLDIGDSSCFQVSRADEYGRYPIFKDKNTVIYSSEKRSDADSDASVVQADISDKNDIKYETLYEWPGLYSVQPSNVDGDMLLFMRKYLHDGENFDSSSPDEYNKDACFYNFAEKTTVCMDENFDLQMIKDDGYKYKHYYVFHSFSDVLVRDLECYCDFYPEKCPLIDYTPNPDNPKEPWKRECK